jgi:hypothetical protein
LWIDLRGKLLNVRGEKLSEEVLFKALTAASADWAASAPAPYGALPSAWRGTIADYTAIPSVADPMEPVVSVGSSPSAAPYYVVYVELGPTGDALGERGPDGHNEAKGQEPDRSSALDLALCKASFSYESYRAKGAIGPPHVRVVKRGTFAALRGAMVASGGASPNQLKVPRVLKSARQIALLQGGVL